MINTNSSNPDSKPQSSVLSPQSRVFVAGHQGLVGSAIVRALLARGHSPQSLVLRTREELDLTRQNEVEKFFEREKPEYVFLSAAKVGGILANSKYPAEFIHENLMIQSNIIDAAYRSGVKKLVFLGSSCIYPKHAPQPMKEEHLLTGPLEPTNEWYAIAKIGGIKMCQAYRRQYGFNVISIMPTNLYGPSDNFDLETSHVLPALIRKFHEAKVAMQQAEAEEGFSQPKPEPQPVVVWGTGEPKREFLYVDDLADACIFLMNLEEETLSSVLRPQSWLINVGIGKEISIKELAELVKEIVGFEGGLVFDTSKPDGMPRKMLDVARLNALGWKAETRLTEGISKTYEWYLDQLV